MKGIMFAMLIAAGIGLIGISTPVSAAPADGIAIGQNVNPGKLVVKTEEHARDRKGPRCVWRHIRFSRSVRRCFW